MAGIPTKYLTPLKQRVLSSSKHEFIMHLRTAIVSPLSLLKQYRHNDYQQANTDLKNTLFVSADSATAAGLEGDFRAWLSDSNSDAICRFNDLTGLLQRDNCNTKQATKSDLGPWIQTNSRLFSQNLARLLEDDVIFYPLRLDE